VKFTTVVCYSISEVLRQKTGDVIPEKSDGPINVVVSGSLQSKFKVGDERDKNGLAISKAVAWDFSVGT
jgi:hypothetical protein